MKYQNGLKTKNRIFSATLAGTLAVISAASLTACGGTAYQEAANAGNIPGSVTGLPGGGTGLPNPAPSLNPNLLPPITQSFTVTGQNGSQPSYSTTINTDTQLAVRITAGPAGTNIVPGVNTSASNPYGCVSYNVSALGQSVTTGLLAVNGGDFNCAGNPSNQVIDFSSRLTPGHGPVTITVQAVGSDFRCLQCSPYNLWSLAGMYNCAMYCPTTPVYQYATATGTLAIQINGTRL